MSRVVTEAAACGPPSLHASSYTYRHYIMDWPTVFAEALPYAARPLSTYRRLAAEQLGPACPTGLVPPSGDALAQVAAEWLDEFERAQLLLRLSPRLRRLHDD